MSPTAAACVAEEPAGRIRDSCFCGTRQILGGRSTVGHGALDAVIGVRIPASQPAPSELVARHGLRSHPNSPRSSTSSRPRLVGNESESLPPGQPPLACGELRLGRPLRGRRTEKRALFQVEAVSTKPAQRAKSDVQLPASDVRTRSHAWNRSEIRFRSAERNRPVATLRRSCNKRG